MSVRPKYQVCVVTGTRAEYGLLRELLFKLKDNSETDLRLVVTGSHLSEKFGNTQEEITGDGFSDYTRIYIPVDDDSKKGMVISTGVAMERFAELFAGCDLDIVIVLGDRFEIFAAAFAAYSIGIPVAHISGGDVTEGAVDDTIRHCLTKMSCLHFPGCEQSRMRLIQMGEQPGSVFNVGEPGIENCLNLELTGREALAGDLNFDGISGDYSVVTFHPVTMENNTAVEQTYELIQAMDSIENMSYVITMANADAGGRAINDIWRKEGEKHHNWLVVASLGMLRYLSAVKYAKTVIGNSSSGIVEAPAMGTPVINIGDRQKGRIMAESVICCPPEKDHIIASVYKALEPDFQERAKHTTSPFGDGTTSARIMDILLKYLKNKGETKGKPFYDIKFEVGEQHDEINCDYTGKKRFKRTAR